jgi:rubrerythrin
MRKMTEDNLKAAFAGESQAHMRYLIFAQAAERDGRANTARLFRAIAYAEQIHATKHFKELGGIKDSAQNLEAAIAGETYEVEEMYPAFNAVAEFQGETGAARCTDWALQAEKVHARMYAQAKQAEDQGKDATLGDVVICDVCGFTAEGSPPEKCPVCGVKADRFTKF